MGFSDDGRFGMKSLEDGIVDKDGACFFGYLRG